MKNILKLIVITILMAAGFVRAANFPAEIPLSLERQEYVAKQIVNYGYTGIQGDTVSGRSIVGKAYTGLKGDLAAVAAMLNAENLDYKVDPTKLVSSFTNYVHRVADGSREFTLFRGQKDWNYVKDSRGNWAPPADKLMVDNMVFERLPVEIPGIYDAYVVYRDEKGNEVGQRQSLGHLIQGNFLVLDRWSQLQGTLGELYIQTNNGLGVYNLDGTLRLSVPMNHSVNSSVVSIRDVAVNSAEIVYRPSDVIVMAKYTVDTIVTVRLSVTGTATPVDIKNVIVVEKRIIDANPLAGAPLDTTKLMTFAVKAGQEWVVIFEKKPKT